MNVLVKGIEGSHIVFIRSTNGTPATAIWNKSGLIFTIFPINNPPAERPTLHNHNTTQHNTIQYGVTFTSEDFRSCVFVIHKELSTSNKSLKRCFSCLSISLLLRTNVSPSLHRLEHVRYNTTSLGLSMATPVC